MDSTKWIIGAAFSVFLGATMVALGQQRHPIDQSMGRTIAPLTPRIKAIYSEMDRLDQAAVAAQNAGDYADAEADARQSIALGQDSGIAQEMLASALYKQGKDKEALQAYKVIADEGGVFSRNLVPYARLLLESGQWAQAVNAYNKMLPYADMREPLWANSHFSPDAPQPKELRIALHIAQGLNDIDEAGWTKPAKREEGMREFDHALRLAPTSALTNYYYGYGWKHLDRNSPMKSADAQRAQAALQKAAASGDERIIKAEETLARFQ